MSIDDDDLDIPAFLQRAEQEVDDANDPDLIGLDDEPDDEVEVEEAAPPKPAKKAPKAKPETKTPRPGANDFASDQLKSIVERIERTEEEKQALAEDIKEIYQEAKGNGFDTKIIRKVVRLRKQDANQRAEEQAVLDLYLWSLGMAT